MYIVVIKLNQLRLFKEMFKNNNDLATIIKTLTFNNN